MTKKSPNCIFIDFNILINSNNSHLTKWFSDLFICVDVEMSEGKRFYSKGDFDEQTPIVFWSIIQQQFYLILRSFSFLMQH